ncbi:MAG: glycine cleavage system aminomethyltransferase GcvT [Hyphomicrobiaceae bacterium]
MGTGAADPAAQLLRTPLYAEHVKLGAKMVPFAGYEMPVQYPLGVLKEHLWTREKAGLFDVSHMGQAALFGPNHDATAAALEALVPGDLLGLQPGRIRYTQLLTDDGGIIDDLMVTRAAGGADDGRLMLVVNASRKAIDYAHIEARLGLPFKLEIAPDRALLALQGPLAERVLAKHCPEAAALAFMAATRAEFDGIECHVSRSGYTGEDGFEISVAETAVATVWQTLTADADVQPIGLGARDSLRLEAGLCLYGHDIDETTSPVEAALTWSIGKRRRVEGGFPGHARIAREIADGPARKRVGIRPEGRQPAREGTVIQDAGGREIGRITSGGFGPSANAPVAMGYVEIGHAAVGTSVGLIVRDKRLAASVTDPTFVPHHYKK